MERTYYYYCMTFSLENASQELYYCVGPAKFRFSSFYCGPLRREYYRNNGNLILLTNQFFVDWKSILQRIRKALLTSKLAFKCDHTLESTSNSDLSKHAIFSAMKALSFVLSCMLSVFVLNT